MPDYAYTVTVGGQTLSELVVNMNRMAETIGQGGSKSDPVPEPETPAASGTPVASRPRGRPPKAASQDKSKPNGEAEPSASTPGNSIPDILKTCWADPNGAARVVAMQKKFGVKRFAEVPDDKVPALLQAAVALQKELTGGGADETEDEDAADEDDAATGPF